MSISIGDRKILVKKKTLSRPKFPVTGPKAQSSAPELAMPTTPPADQREFDSSIKTYIHPHYPRLAFLRGDQGQVKIRIQVAPNGMVKKVSLMRSSGHQTLDIAATDAAYQWIFYPFPANRHPELIFAKEIVFSIH